MSTINKYEFNYELDDNNLIVRLKDVDKPGPTIVRTDNTTKWSTNKTIERTDAIMFALHSLMSRLVYTEPPAVKLEFKKFYTVIYKFKSIYHCSFKFFNSRADISKEVEDICSKLNISLKDIEIRQIENTAEEAINKYINKSIYAVYKGFFKKHLYFTCIDKSIDIGRYNQYPSQKKYCFTYYNYIACEDQMEFILANDLHQAKQLAVLYMRLRCGNSYNVNNISSIEELDDSYFYSLGDIKAKYESLGKQFEMPDIIEGEDEYDD